MKNKTFASEPEKNPQKGNKDWWENNPMTYQFETDNITGDTSGFSKIPNSPKELSKDWFLEVDKIFFDMAAEFANSESNKSLPFSKLIDYESLKGKKVLEIGCGMGSHSALISQYASELVSIDLTERAVKTTNKRFEIFDIDNAKAIQVDAENMPFEDNSFDFVWSWGVIHHSANTHIIVDQIHRVLKDDGKASLMVYNKNSTRYYLHGLYQGIFKLKFLKYRSLYEVNMTFTDGFIARHYTRKSGKALFKKFSNIKTSVTDSGVPTVIIGWGRLTRLLPTILNPINKWINNRFGWFLILNVKK
ncbi:class I SAM-dependent methyltransferase [Gammaproteobacteria bacterium]|jgi:ubiquinone/menaquinone biosynthesis C-methylase UbiE|nr:class I SAM-dependent methyltransferase [Gammaproteobacteria bacterium]|tara:strand:- start:7999 stop:8910 length:912 start_codon:yes stop_codon:yes gene_type:complete